MTMRPHRFGGNTDLSALEAALGNRIKVKRLDGVKLALDDRANKATHKRQEAPLSDKTPLYYASSMLGKNTKRDIAVLRKFMKNGGVNDLDPATTAWCAAFVNASLGQGGVKGTGKPNARSFLKWGHGVKTPKKGDIVVFYRGNPSGWQGHVAFFDSYDKNGNISVLGGNQDNGVSIKSYPLNRLLGFRRVGTPSDDVSLKPVINKAPIENDFRGRYIDEKRGMLDGQGAQPAMQQMAQAQPEPVAQIAPQQPQLASPLAMQQMAQAQPEPVAQIAPQQPQLASQPAMQQMAQAQPEPVAQIAPQQPQLASPLAMQQMAQAQQDRGIPQAMKLLTNPDLSPGQRALMAMMLRRHEANHQPPMA